MYLAPNSAYTIYTVKIIDGICEASCMLVHTPTKNGIPAHKDCLTCVK